MVDVLVKRLSNSRGQDPAHDIRAADRCNAGLYGRIHHGQPDSSAPITGMRNRRTGLMLSVFVREVEFIEEELDGAKTNTILLDGYICKEPVYRKTPLGREIADLLLAVNRPYGKSDYIPCICWGRNARFAAGFQVGEHVQILGRIQSREYVKKAVGDGDTEKSGI